ncbi:MAG: hypothetical protein B7Z55_08825 [Planctomycetales bacterium 12-60-4]|nr:MAG: hypothetical protein B7Z55_08825 [Planctomycetales bacterium 12-60-4]
MQILFHPRAADEFRRARQWYRDKDPRTAERFVREMSQALDRILADPDSFAVFRQEFRQVQLRRFPYVVSFRIEGDDLIGIYAVSHARRRPGYWRRRRL